MNIPLIYITEEKKTVSYHCPIRRPGVMCVGFFGGVAGVASSFVIRGVMILLFFAV